MKQSPTGNYSFLNLKTSLGVETVYGNHVSHDFSRHTHRTLCIGIVEQGIRNFSCRSQIYHVSPGQVFVIPPNEAHSCRPAGASHTYRLLLVSAKILHTIFAAEGEPESRQPIFQQLVWDSPCLFEQLLSLHDVLASNKSDFIKQSALHSVINNVLDQCVLGFSSVAITHRHQESIQRVQCYIEEHCAETLTLDALASLAFLGPFYLLRIFSLETGVPPHIYQQQARIRQAKLLLGQGLSLAEVALQTGFSDQSHFTNVFKKMVGLPPGEYRTPLRPG